MNKRSIKDIEATDFVGLWYCKQNFKIKLYVTENFEATITMEMFFKRKIYKGNFQIKYIEVLNRDSNFIIISIGEFEFYIKQIDDTGFYLTFSEDFLKEERDMTEQKEFIFKDVYFQNIK